MTLLVEHQNDLWTLHTILDKGDTVSAKTTRKVTLGDKASEKTKSVVKQVFLTIDVEKTTFTDRALRILGQVTEGTEDVPQGSHHTIAIEPGQSLTVTKDWPKYQKDRINEAVNTQPSTIIACLFNREEALFGVLENNSFRTINSLAGTVEKKDKKTQSTNFYAEIAQRLAEINQQYDPHHIILGSSHFWKAPMQKELEHAGFKNKVLFTTVDAVSSSGFSEVLKKGDVKQALSSQHAHKDTVVIEEVFRRIAKDEPVCYGAKDCRKAADAGAVETLLCTETLIKERREEETFGEIEQLFKDVEKQQGSVHIVMGNHEAARRLDGLGGIAGLLRFSIA